MKKITTDEENLTNISRSLMLHGSFTRNLGLMSGKMGTVLFFYHYARYTGDVNFRKFAEEILNEVYEEITSSYPYNFSDGLCGIAWSMVYLIRNGFVSTDDEKDLLSELDDKVMEWDVRRLHDASFETGTLGLGHYILSRYNPQEKVFYLPQDYLQDYFEVARRNNHYEINQIIGEMNRGNLSHKTYLNNFLLYRSFKNDINKPTKPETGILVNGLAGNGLSIMLRADVNDEKNRTRKASK